jgi:hypothetical protein
VTILYFVFHRYWITFTTCYLPLYNLYRYTEDETDSSVLQGFDDDDDDDDGGGGGGTSTVINILCDGAHLIGSFPAP